VVSGNQQYGLIESLFPELAGRVSMLDSRFAYAPMFSKHRIIEPYYNMGIPLGIRLRIAKAASLEIGGRFSGSAPRQLIISLGPRFMDRSCINKQECYKTLFEVCRLYGFMSIKIILDISSQLDEQRFSPSMDEVDKLASYLTEHAGLLFDTHEIQILHNLPLAASLRILNETHFGLYEWGGGLTKYSWILGKPCIITAPTSVNSRICESLINKACWGTYVHEAARDTPYLVSNTTNNESAIQREHAAFLIDYNVNLGALRDAVSRCIYESLHLEIC